MLISQAIITLLLGTIFLSQIINIDAQKIIKAEITIDESDQSPQLQTTIPSETEKQYPTAAYILLFVSLIELIIITRLLT